MTERRLLERIAAQERESGGSCAYEVRLDVFISSVVAHLVRILNTRQGSVPIDAEFGVPDLAVLASSFGTGSAQRMGADIAQTISRYEPRLTAVRVCLLDRQADAFSLSFGVEGEVIVDDRKFPIMLITRVSPEGCVSTWRE